MNLQRVNAVVLRHAYEARHNMTRITDIVYWPVLNIIMWGFFTVYLDRGARLRPGFISFLLGAAILWGLFYGFQRDMAVGFLDELWSRNLVNLFASPLTLSEYMTGLIATNLLKTIISLAAAALVGWAFYAYNIFPVLPLLVPFIFNLALFGLAIGLVITGLIFRYTTRIHGLAWSFAGSLMPFSCVFYPLASLPKFLRPFAWVLPTTHAFEGMRDALAHHGFSMSQFEWGLALNAVYLVAAILAFIKLFNSARSHGLLVKLE